MKSKMAFAILMFVPVVASAQQYGQPFILNQPAPVYIAPPQQYYPPLAIVPPAMPDAHRDSVLRYNNAATDNLNLQNQRLQQQITAPSYGNAIPSNDYPGVKGWDFEIIGSK